MSLSDRRDLKKILKIYTDCGLDFINDFKNSYIQMESLPSEADSSMPTYDKCISTPSYGKTQCTGFIAQEVTRICWMNIILTYFNGWI